MQKTKILLGGGNGAGARIFGTLFLLIGGGIVAANQLGVIPPGVIPEGLIPENMGYLVDVTGGIIAVLGIILFASAKGKSSVNLDNERLMMKTGSKKGGTDLAWNEIKSVVFKSYLIVLDTANGTIKLPYSATPEVSKSVKRAIKAFAEKKGIPVYAG